MLFPVTEITERVMFAKCVSHWIFLIGLIWIKLDKPIYVYRRILMNHLYADKCMMKVRIYWNWKKHNLNLNANAVCFSRNHLCSFHCLNQSVVRKEVLWTMYFYFLLSQSPTGSHHYGWLGTWNDTPFSASQRQGLQVCINTHGFERCFSTLIEIL